jgi:hypothetical protein
MFNNSGLSCFRPGWSQLAIDFSVSQEVNQSSGKLRKRLPSCEQFCSGNPVSDSSWPNSSWVISFLSSSSMFRPKWFLPQELSSMVYVPCSSFTYLCLCKVEQFIKKLPTAWLWVSPLVHMIISIRFRCIAYDQDAERYYANYITFQITLSSTII